MIVRKPNWDFSKIRAHWSPHKEFAQMYNAFSTVPAHIEPYLVKVMRQAKKELDPKHEQLHADLDIFIKQEMQHCKNHIAFNKSLHDQGYEGMLEFEDKYAADYDRFLKEKSLRFNCAYSEGFEAMSAVAVTAFFEQFDEFLEGADQDAADLWRWHLAEEYEHREVALDVYRALFGRGIFSYVYRIYGFFVATRHISAHTARVADYLLSKDRESMTAEELEASKAREAAVKKETKRRAWEHLREILFPFYEAGTRKPPKGLEDVLKRFEPQAA